LSMNELYEIAPEVIKKWKNMKESYQP
jgi:hypothetical protein